MGTEVHLLACTVYLNDADEVAAKQGELPGGTNQVVGRFYDAPDLVSARYNAPLYGPGEFVLAGQNGIQSDWFGTSANFPTNLATFLREDGGWFGIHWLFGTDHRYYWTFTYKYNPPLEKTDGGVARVAMAKRRWIDGMELSQCGEGWSHAGGSYLHYSPGASRHVGGKGYHVRNGINWREHRSDEPERDTAYHNEGWERFYFRVRKFPSIAARFWTSEGLPSASLGMRLKIQPDGRIAVVGMSAGNVENPYGTTAEPLVLDTWYKLDLVYKGGGTGFFLLFINGVYAAGLGAGSMDAAYGISGTTSITTSTLGGAAAGHLGAWDFDDWIGADLPVDATTKDFRCSASVDWLHGSKVMVADPIAFAASNDGDFVGPGGADAQDWRMLVNRDIQFANVWTNLGLSTTVASKRCAVVIDTAPVFASKGCMGYAAMMAACQSSLAGASNADGQIGYKLPGGAEVLTTCQQEAASNRLWNRGYCFPAAPGLEPLPAPEAGLEVTYVGNSSAVGKTLYNLVAVFELIGDFYPEDYVRLTGDPATLTPGADDHFAGSRHNHAYPNTPWSMGGVPPMAPLFVKGGTYVGNGKSTQLAFRAPVNWLFIRRVHATPESANWIPVAIGDHLGFRHQVLGDMQVLVDRSFAPPAAEGDQSMQVLVRLVGNSVSTNENGTTYNYLAMMDPGFRFLETGVLKHNASGMGLQTDALLAGWKPEFFLVQINSNQAATLGTFEFGQGVVAPEGFKVSAAKAATALTVQDAGALEYPDGSALYFASGGAGALSEFAAFRKDDGSGDEDVATILNITSYTGDGTASRTITFAPASNRRPMWALVVGSSTTSAYRDPSHTGTTSTVPISTANASTGITAGGIDSISVGSALNANGVVYDVLVFWAADATPGNNGWGTNGENGLRPTTPGNGPWGPHPGEPGEPAEPPVTPDVPGGPGSPGNEGDYDFSTDCVIPSTKIINIALARIGISKQVGDILTEVSAEAVQGRLHYSNDVSATLRDFPWPFATRYAKMQLVAGDATLHATVQAWSATRTYEVGQVVRVYDEAFPAVSTYTDYYCTVAHLNHTPPNAGYWSTTPPEEVNGDWLYAYRVPDLFVFARRIVNNALKTRRGWDLNPIPFRLGSDDFGLLIYTNEVDAELEYTVRLYCAAEVGDPIFRSALAWRHAHSIAPSLARDEKKVAYCWSMYQDALAQAKRWAASEKQDEHEGDNDWIAGRN